MPITDHLLPLLNGTPIGRRGLTGKHLPMQAIPCRGCGSTDVQTVLDLGAQPHCNRLVLAGEPDAPHYPLRLGFCHACTLVQIDHTIPKETMFADYPYVSGTTATLRDHFRQSAARLAILYGLGPADLVVDIGSNDGTWLAQYGPTGCRVLGVEPAENVARIASVRTINRFFDADCADTILSSHGPAKLITAAGVFFHLEDLHSVCDGIGDLLAPDGVLVVQAIYLGGMIANTAFDQIYHEHLCYYTLRSLAALLARHGLEVFDVAVLPIHGGSIECHIGRAAARPINGRVWALVEKETAQLLGSIGTYQSFAYAVDNLRRTLRETLYQYLEAGKTVWAYGAPAKGATLLNSFGIQRYLVSKAVEKNPMKIGREIPGCRIPIVAESPARPDAYLMLAWNFLEEFITKERDWLGAGGEFIVPVPRVQIIASPKHDS